MPIRKVTDPALLQQLGGSGQVVAPNPMFPGQVENQQLGIDKNRAELPYVAPKARADATAAQADATIKVNQAVNSEAVARAQRDQAVAEAQKAGLELQKMKLGNQMDPERAKALHALQAQLDRVGELFRSNVQGGLPNPIFGYVPTSGNKQFDTAGQGLVNPFQAAFRIAGQGSQSDTELKQFIEANRPDATDTDAAIQEKMRNIQTRIDAELGAQPATAPVPQSAQPQQPQMGLAQGPTRAQIDPALKATGQRVGAMIARGVPDAQIVGFLQQSGVDPNSTNIGQVLKFRQTPDFKAWQRANPGRPYDVGPEFYTKQVPMTPTRQLMNNVSQSPVGAFNAAAANAIVGGRLDNIVGSTTGDPQMAQTGMEMLRSNNPTASFLGDVAGQALDEAALGRIPGAQSLLATRYGRRGADALYGAFAGSGEDNSDPLGGGLTGAVTNTLGGMIGRGAQTAAGRTLAGVKNAHLQYLDNRGVPLTLGQIARGSENTLGHAVGGIEERLAGLPVADAIIGSARRRGDEGFNRVLFDQIAPGVKATGSEGLAQARAAEQAAYSKLNPVRISVDPEFDAGVSAVADAAKGLDHHANDVASVVNDIRSQISNGEMTGKGYQTALQTIRKTRSSLNDDVGGKAADALDGLESEVMGLGARQGGQVGQDLAAANAIHSRIKVVEDALKKAPSQRNEELISPMTLNQSSINNTVKFGGPARALSPDRPFYDLTDAGKAVMPNLTPDSGTAGRTALYYALLGAGGGGLGAMGAENHAEGGLSGAATGLTLASLLAAPYSRGGQKLIQKTLLGDRPDVVVKLGDFLINKRRLAGLLGSGMARDYAIQPELP